ncbi:MAG: hypothetical protein AB1505_32750 [Candidatus Latescibacterota bacterium]
MRRTLGAVCGLLLPVLAVSGCAWLTPIRTVERVALEPVPAGPDAVLDPVDSSLVYSREGLRVRVRHVPDADLNAQVPGPENPFTYRDEVDYRRRYVPVRFTVFQVTVNNPTFDKVLLQPEKAVLVTDRGARLPAYVLTRAEAHGDARNFETYWLSRGVQSGNAQRLYLERMSVLRGSIYHQDSFVFKGKDYTGMIAFDPLPPGTRQATLVLGDFVLEFGIYDIPRTTLDLGFVFAVERAVVEPAPDAGASTVTPLRTEVVTTTGQVQ